MTSEVTVRQLANTVGIPEERLLTQLHEAGIAAANAEATITEQEKVQLLGFLRRSHGKQGEDDSASPSRVTQKRKSVSELRQTPAAQRPASGSRPTVSSRAGNKTAGNKTVSVEVRRKRTYVRRGEPEGAAPAAARGSERQTLEQPVGRRRVDSAEPARSGNMAGGRDPGADARRRAELEARRAEEESRRLAEREELEREERAAEARRRSAEEERRKSNEEARRLADEQAEQARLAGELDDSDEVAGEALPPVEEPDTPSNSNEGRARKPSKKGAERGDKERGEKDRGEKDKDKLADKDKPAKKGARKEPGRAKRLDAEVEYAEETSDEEVVVSRPAVRRRKKPAKAQLQDKHGFQRPTAPVVREVEIPEAISVGELASRMSVKASQVVKELFKQGVMVTINQLLDRDTATIVVEEMGHTPVEAKDHDVEDTLLAYLEAENEKAERVPRAPVVTIMGHVDHGKTSLLDYIRRAKVADGEAGGITQHIGAYHVTSERGTICFLDTPGHAAFSSMRARGAEVTDLVILVVAADDGVMPQTIEAIQHARASKVPLVVAINKMDKADANPDRVMQELSQHEVVSEEWGGDTMMVKVSAKSGDGIDDLLDAVLLQAEVLELEAPVGGSVHGAIVESSLEKGRGPVATVLVQSGTLRAGDMIVSGSEYGRVRAMFDETGRAVQEAGPSIPVQVLGLSGTPNAGDDVISVADEKRAREVAELRSTRERQSKIDAQGVASLDALFGQLKAGERKSVNLILKADVQGSLEALKDSLVKLSNDEVKVGIVGSGVGGLTESDANLAITSNAILLGFNVRADAAARRTIEEKGLDLRYYSVIYELIDDVKKAISGLLSPIISEEIIGLATVRDVFRSSKFGAIAGSMVIEGVIRRNSPIRVLRDNVVVYEGALESLRRFKDDVSEVKAGTECGIGVKNYNDVQVGDQVEVFERTERARVL
ncbi:translation initiation factor IF-2 [Thiorhodovibrio frisius]|uniref:Translation initiation factor IF-2 n=1 Tax=Thiorhodovibrio frisius TaxID=631362 RepID=H8Z4A2_9GAMM|nr:translation initiation factor IF-2 [Thiorhodovibrio frisius]EIC20159.1 translation initiation factor IF-2 [Thiorhodovibrio frisius]WPL20896.1 Translation initiation factor IF-2 [Thiorhodovibrio frisius]